MNSSASSASGTTPAGDTPVEYAPPTPEDVRGRRVLLAVAARRHAAGQDVGQLLAGAAHVSLTTARRAEFFATYCAAGGAALVEAAGVLVLSDAAWLAASA